GVTYYYAVFAMNGSASGPLYSSGVYSSGVPSAVPTAAPIAPTDLTAIAGTNYVNISWTGPNAASYLVVHRASSAPTLGVSDETHYSQGAMHGDGKIVYIGSGKSFQ